jgi:hypothetical protein
MKRLILAVAAFVAMTSTSFGIITGVTLDYVENPDPAAGLKSYTVQATGIGINVLGRFVITGDVYQVWTAPNTQSEWIGIPSTTPGDPKDSFVTFGTLRIPDLAGLEGDMESASLSYTMETIHNGGIEGLGTLNNLDPVTGKADAYLVLGNPSGAQETHDLFQLVVPENQSVLVELDVYTAEYDPETGYYTDITEYNFFGNDALRVPVPEPTTVVLLVLGAVFLAFRRVR